MSVPAIIKLGVLEDILLISELRAGRKNKRRSAAADLSELTERERD